MTKKLSFTLFEILIALSIVISAISVIGINLKGQISKKRVEKEFFKLSDQIQLASDIVLQHDIDIDLILKKSNSELFVEIVVDHPKFKSYPLKSSYPLFRDITFLELNDNKEEIIKSDEVTLNLSYYGTHQNAKRIELKDELGHTHSMLLLDYPHVLEIEKK